MTLDKSSPMSKRYGRSVTKYDVSSGYCDDMYPTEGAKKYLSEVDREFRMLCKVLGIKVAIWTRIDYGDITLGFHTAEWLSQYKLPDCQERRTVEDLLETIFNSNQNTLIGEDTCKCT